MSGQIEYVNFQENHLAGVVSCARVLEWPSYQDPAVATAALTSPSAVAWVALHGLDVVGLAYLLTDGVVQSHLSLVGVVPEHRRKGVARRLVTRAFQQSGAKWLDLYSEAGAEDFYRSFLRHEFVGFRVYPS